LKRFAALLAVVAVVLLLAAPASAQTTLTLSAAAGKIEFGQGVSLSGTASAAGAGTTIDIRNGAGASIASATTDAAGAFSAEIHPQGSDTYVAVLGDALWRSHFNADPRVLGRTIRLNRRSYTIIGVAPEGFTGVTNAAIDAWVPLTANVTAEEHAGWLRSRQAYWLRLIVGSTDGMSRMVRWPR